MSKVYVVTTGTYSDYSIRGIFSTRRKAEEYMKKCSASEACWNKDFNELDERPLDAELAERTYQRHTIGLMLDTGEVKEGPYIQEYWGIPESKHYLAEDVPCYQGRDIIRAESCKSAKHAMKLAVEARQAALRGGQ